MSVAVTRKTIVTIAVSAVAIIAIIAWIAAAGGESTARMEQPAKSRAQGMEEAAEAADNAAAGRGMNADKDTQP
jgi:hypothetical protein